MLIGYIYIIKFWNKYLYYSIVYYISNKFKTLDTAFKSILY